MKVVAINGSPKAEGNTARALQIVAEVLKENGVETEVFHLGMAAGCTGCYSCAKRRDGTCVLPDDGVNACIQAISKADGVLIGAPVYYSSIPGRLKGVLDPDRYRGGQQRRSAAPQSGRPCHCGPSDRRPSGV